MPHILQSRSPSVLAYTRPPQWEHCEERVEEGEEEEEEVLDEDDQEEDVPGAPAPSQPAGVHLMVSHRVPAGRTLTSSTSIFTNRLRVLIREMPQHRARTDTRTYIIINPACIVSTLAVQTADYAQTAYQRVVGRATRPLFETKGISVPLDNDGSPLLHLLRLRVSLNRARSQSQGHRNIIAPRVISFLFHHPGIATVIIFDLSLG